MSAVECVKGLNTPWNFKHKILGHKASRWSDIVGSRCIKRHGKEICQKELRQGVLYSNAKGWCTREIFQAEVVRFSKFLEKHKPNKKCCLLLDNFSGHKIDLAALGVKNLRLEFFEANCTGTYQSGLGKVSSSFLFIFVSELIFISIWQLELKSIASVMKIQLDVGREIINTNFEIIVKNDAVNLESLMTSTGLIRVQPWSLASFKYLLMSVIIVLFELILDALFYFYNLPSLESSPAISSSLRIWSRRIADGSPSFVIRIRFRHLPLRLAWRWFLKWQWRYPRVSLNLHGKELKSSASRLWR